MSFLSRFLKKKATTQYNSSEEKKDRNTIIDSIIEKQFFDFTDSNLSQNDKDNNQLKLAFLIITLLLYPEIYKLPQTIISNYQRLPESLINKYSNDMEYFFRDVKNLISQTEQYGGSKRKTIKNKKSKKSNKTKYRK
jgi:hypothetical protein